MNNKKPIFPVSTDPQMEWVIKVYIRLDEVLTEVKQLKSQVKELKDVAYKATGYMTSGVK